MRDDLLWWIAKAEDPELKAREREILQALLGANPDVRQQLIGEGLEKGLAKGIEQGIERGRLAEARAALRRVLARRQLALRPEDDARIEGCADLEALERWLDRAVTAASTSEALR